MASVSYGTIPRSKIKTYAEEELGLFSEEVDFFVSVMRRVESKSTEKKSDPKEVKDIVTELAASRDKKNPHKKKMPRVRHPRP